MQPCHYSRYKQQRKVVLYSPSIILTKIQLPFDAFEASVRVSQLPLLHTPIHISCEFYLTKKMTSCVPECFTGIYNKERQSKKICSKIQRQATNVIKKINPCSINIIFFRNNLI